MEELIKTVSERAGIGADKAKTAVETVLNFLKNKLPGPVASQLDSAVESGTAAGAVDQAAKILGGMFGKS
jgi:hypothetical protein